MKTLLQYTYTPITDTALLERLALPSLYVCETFSQQGGQMKEREKNTIAQNIFSILYPVLQPVVSVPPDRDVNSVSTHCTTYNSISVSVESLRVTITFHGARRICIFDYEKQSELMNQSHDNPDQVLQCVHFSYIGIQIKEPETILDGQIVIYNISIMNIDHMQAGNRLPLVLKTSDGQEYDMNTTSHTKLVLGGFVDFEISKNRTVEGG